MRNHTIQENDVVVFWTSDNHLRTVRVLKEKSYRSNIGECPLGDLIGREYGCRVDLVKGWGLALPPAMEDRIMMVRRSTNIIYPKDLGIILMKMPLERGDQVVEIGTGSGALTAALAAAVSPGGAVHTFDIEPARIPGAKKNIRRSGVQGEIHFHVREPGKPLPVEPVRSVFLDIPEPWEEIGAVDQILLKGGRVASMNPTYNQVEKMAGAMAERGYIMIEGVESIFRRIVVAPGRVRPARTPIPHTEFLLFGVKSGEEIPDGIHQFFADK